MKTTTKLWIGIGILAIVSPLGLYVPQVFNAGAAWGEWGSDEIKDIAGYLPRGLERLASLWKALLPDYTFKGWENKGLGHLSIAYIVSALVGISLCVGTALAIGKILVKKQRDREKKNQQLP